jgi:hypothetical protein
MFFVLEPIHTGSNLRFDIYVLFMVNYFLIVIDNIFITLSAHTYINIYVYTIF